MFSEWRGSSTHGRPNANNNLVSKKCHFCLLGTYMGPFIGMQPDFFAEEVSFRVRYGAPKVRSLRKIRVGVYRGTPRSSNSTSPEERSSIPRNHVSPETCVDATTLHSIIPGTWQSAVKNMGQRVRGLDATYHIYRYIHQR